MRRKSTGFPGVLPAVARHSMGIAMAAPEVVAHRVLRMMLAGKEPSKRDRAEFDLMSSEKVAAFYESALHFKRIADRVIESDRQTGLTGVRNARVRQATLQLGDERSALEQYLPAGHEHERHRGIVRV